MRHYFVRIMALATFSICVAGIGTAQMQKSSTPHLKGTWKGTATKTICGNAAGTAQVELVLEDQPYKPAGNELATGNVSGTLAVDGALQGPIVADYTAPELKANALAMMVPLSAKKTFADYYFDFTAKDAMAGVGYYQTLSGKLFRKDLNCMNLGDTGEMLKVDLKKQ